MTTWSIPSSSAYSTMTSLGCPTSIVEYVQDRDRRFGVFLEGSIECDGRWIRSVERDEYPSVRTPASRVYTPSLYTVGQRLREVASGPAPSDLSTVLSDGIVATTAIRDRPYAICPHTLTNRATVILSAVRR